MEKILFIVVLIIFITGCMYAFTLRPISKLEGELKVPGLKDEVRIIRDKYGIPHIFAHNEDDSYIAIGYVQAHDRLWQMDVMRHFAEGRLSEVIGNQEFYDTEIPGKTTLDIDYYQRVIGFKYISENAVKKLDTRTKRILELYASGINAYVQQNTDSLSDEFVIMHHRFEPWKPEDTISLTAFMGWTTNDDCYNTVLIRYGIAIESDVSKAWEILPKHFDPGPFILEELIGRKQNISDERIYEFSSSYDYKEIVDLLKMSNLVQDINSSIVSTGGSNSWVISGEKSATGKPILCNDSHLFLIIPSEWYEAHINYPGTDVIGVMFIGTPAVAIGHNRTISWGITQSEEDSSDIFIEKVNPKDSTEYLYKGTYRKFDIRIEKLYYKKGSKMQVVERPVRMTVHGPVINDVMTSIKDSKELFALKWTAYDFLNSENLNLGILRLGEAKDWDEFTEYANIGTLIPNWVYADINGNIGYIAPGLIPIRAKGDGTYPAPGWTGEYDWVGYVPKDEMPQIYNPSKGFIVTANNQIFPEGAYPYTFSKQYHASYRAERIRELLLEKENLDIEDMKRIQVDVYSKQGERLAKYFIDAYENSNEKDDPLLKKAVDALKDWDYETDLDSIGSTIFHTAYGFAFEKIFKDEVSYELFKMYENVYTIDNTFDNILENDKFMFFDDKNRKGR